MREVLLGRILSPTLSSRGRRGREASALPRLTSQWLPSPVEPVAVSRTAQADQSRPVKTRTIRMSRTKPTPPLGADDYRPCENVCGLLEAFAWRVPRSSRVSRDLEKVLSRFCDFASGVDALGLGRTR